MLDDKWSSRKWKKLIYWRRFSLIHSVFSMFLVCSCWMQHAVAGISKSGTQQHHATGTEDIRMKNAAVRGRQWWGGGRGYWSCYIPFYSRLVHHWTWPVVQTFQEHYRADDSAMGLAFEQLISIYNRYLQYNEKCIFTRTKVFGGRFSFYMQFFFVCLLVFYLLLLCCRFEWCNAH